MNKLIYASFLTFFIFSCNANNAVKKEQAAKDVLVRTIGLNNADKFEFKYVKADDNDNYSIEVKNNKVYVSGSSPVAMCRGAYDYLKIACNSIVSWSGNRINIPQRLPEYSVSVESPYKYHFYFNVVTHGYSTPYWDWERWQKEIDWMAVHGINMPLLPGAHEAILYRVFKKLGLPEDEINSYFTGPAHFPWNRMGNITGWDGPLPTSFFDKQLALAHKIQDRVKELGMHPIVPAFAGFVPEGITEIFPDEKVRELSWGGFERQYQAHILEPGSDLFIKIGKMYITEYEKEFGKQEFYLADSFNEMDVPLSDGRDTALKELAGYGEAVYRSITEANNDAVWVMQGWTFPYQKKDGKLFWTPERLHALVSKIPDDKLLVLDLANEYNRLWWKTEPSWKMYSGFFGKQWIYSFIPNMGGKMPLNGRLDLYATMPFEALRYPEKGNLVGFGFAPEGIENNEIIYELLSDVGWSKSEVDLSQWLRGYCIDRYGLYDNNMKKAYEYFNSSCFGSFTDHPRFKYQTRPDSKNNGSVNKSDDFIKGVKYFLACRDSCADNDLYITDAIEFTCQYLGLEADRLLMRFQKKGEKDDADLKKALEIMAAIDRLLESHPNWRLEQWDSYARQWGDTPEEKAYYQSNARRLITTWGGWVNEYASKTWSGLIRDYYIPRWKLYNDAKKAGKEFKIKEWEENWINSTDISKIEPFKDPLNAAYELFVKFRGMK